MGKVKNARKRSSRINIFYHIGVAFKSIKRNKTISIASVTTVLTTLLILGVFLLMGLNIKASISEMQSKVEVKVFLQDNITDEDKENIKDTINELSGIREISYETKEEALANFRNQVGDNEEILEGYDDENNPLPTSYIVKLEDIEFANDLEESLIVSTDISKSGKKAVEYLSGIESIGNDQEFINKIASFAKTANLVGGILLVILICVSLILIMNTIRITVFSRRREISIMKFVGATDWFIRWPFIVEGMVIGLLGAAISIGIIYFGYSALYNQINNNVSMLNGLKLIDSRYILETMSYQFAGVGMAIGAFGSIIALRKFLDV